MESSEEISMKRAIEDAIPNLDLPTRTTIPTPGIELMTLIMTPSLIPRCIKRLTITWFTFLRSLSRELTTILDLVCKKDLFNAFASYCYSFY